MKRPLSGHARMDALNLQKGFPARQYRGGAFFMTVD
jgi:hypothetical protein